VLHNSKLHKFGTQPRLSKLHENMLLKMSCS